MKKIIIITLLNLFFLSSCWKDEITNTSETNVENILNESNTWEMVDEKWVVEETVEIIDWYWETLTESVQDAKKAVDLINDRYSDLPSIN